MSGLPVERLGSLDTPWDESKVVPCRWVFEGMSVWVRAGNGSARRGVVTHALGHHAKVKVGDDHSWFNIADLCVPRKAGDDG